MPNTHTIVNSTHMMAWDNDALNVAGVYEAGDLDNGRFVVLGAMNQSATNDIQGYEFAVTPATADSVHVYLVDSPEVGTDVLMQEMADPRYFYNKAGRTMSLKYVMPHVDYIEIDATAFTGGTLPTSAMPYAILAADGMLTATAADQAATTGAYFRFVGNHSISVGMEQVPTVVLRCERN